MPLSQPRSILLEVIVSGSSTPVVKSYYDNRVVPGTLHVNVGDRVAWLVVVAFADGRRSLPYDLTFNDVSFFGVTSLSVPLGGTSKFLEVRAVQGKVSYGLNVSGLGCVFDPEIQSGGGTAIIEAEQHATAFTVTWNTDTNAVSNSAGGNWPLTVSVANQDTVEFIVANAAGAGSGFFVLFAAGDNQWGSPFSLNQTKFPGSVAYPLSTGPQPAEDGADSTGTIFPFSGSIVMGDQMQTTDPAKVYSIKLGA